ncbi:MAG: tRNA dihydrouridine synthase DusB [Syntrophomonadales bacterium]|jgi:nifR3 family TIM-barrel protein
MGFSIGKHAFKNRVVSAPMAGITDKAYRIMAASFGCGLNFTEMISDQALLHGHHKTMAMLDVSQEMIPAVVQLFGGQPQNMARAAAIAEEQGAIIIDINMGCPTPKIVKNGEGAALMKDLPRAREVIRAVVKAVRVPVTVKMRKGWDESSINYLELCRIAEAEGVQAITLHPRTREQFFSGRADWTAIREAKAAVGIPVIGNGDIFEAADALEMIRTTGCDAVMIGRGALGNPFLFAAATALLNGEALPPEPTVQERMQTALQHFDLMANLKGINRTVAEMRKHLAWYIKGIPGAAQARNRLNQATAREEIFSILQAISDEEI